jgi:hypothetical protein
MWQHSGRQRYKIPFALLALPSLALATPVVVPLGGNAFLTQTSNVFDEGIYDDGLHNWDSPNTVISVYFHAAQAGSVDVALVGGLFDSTQSTVQVSVGSQIRQVALSPAGVGGTIFPVGTFQISAPGYVKIDLQGVSKNGSYFGDISGVQIDGTAAGGAVFANDSANFYWSRRGASVHLTYNGLPANSKYLYSEITVPQGQDATGSYYEANGFDAGYFGMQVNSPTERRVLFSVWDFDATAAGETTLVVAGPGVSAQRFGGEGTGGQSFLDFNWVAARTYGFITRQRPGGSGNTQYTAWFKEVVKPGGDEILGDSFDGPAPWNLIATWQYATPQPFTYWYSFVECFDPELGYLSRFANFGNQWAVGANGVWTELTSAWFDSDPTGSNQQRLDVGGGRSGSDYYLHMDGFFNPTLGEHANQTFTRDSSGPAPQVDLTALPEA